MAVIEFAGISKAYRSLDHQTYEAVRAFNLKIESGEFFCLLGPSGCGKTTILGMLAGFDSPSSGEILLDGMPIAGPSRDRGVVFQGDDSLYPWLTAIENVGFGLRLRGAGRAARHASALKYLDLVGLRGQESKYPPELSGGMKQRIQIARALANEPMMLLMDEPFGAVDAQTRGIMQREMRRIWQATHVTVFFITHDIDEAITLASRVGVMTAGPGGTIKEIIPIAIEGERSRNDPQYAACYARIYEAIREEVDRANDQSRMGAL
jgi:NitT/TauT family transport system ATP-binding protein